jgi:two-component system chemotaxis sensor kinase CheA
MSPKEVTNLIFESGLSTATTVSEVSGRGVGMDIVRSNILKLGGLIDVETTPGQGSVFTLRLPLTLAIIRGLLVRVNGMVYVLPLGSVVETLRIDPSEVQSVRQREVVVIRGTTTPLVHMKQVFQVGQGEDTEAESLYVVVVGIAEQRVGLVVDGLVGEHEVVIKSLSRHCGEVSGISGATILGNGRVALIVDVNGLLIGERK